MKTTSKIKMTSKMKKYLKNEEDLKNEDNLKNWPSPPNYFVPPLKKLPDISLMTSHLDSHTTPDSKPEILSSVQTRNGILHDKYNLRGIANWRRNRKDNIFKKRRLVKSFTNILQWGQGTCTLK